MEQESRTREENSERDNVEEKHMEEEGREEAGVIRKIERHGKKKKGGRNGGQEQLSRTCKKEKDGEGAK